MPRKMVALLMLVFLCFSLPVLAAEEGVMNGDFSGGLTHWSQPAGAAVEDGALHLSGAKAVYISQRVFNVIPGKTYTLSGRYKAADGGAALKIEWLAPNALGSYPVVGETFKSVVASAKWEPVSYAVVAPQKAMSAVIMVRKVSQTAGDVYWDDISLTGDFSETEGIANGSFSDAFAGWSEPSGAAVKDGALHLSGAPAVYISQRVYHIKAGNTYTLSGKYKAASGGAALKIEWQVASGTNSYGNVGEFYKSVAASSAWKTVEATVTAPEFATSAVIMVRKVSTSNVDVYWDDISLTGQFGETVPEENPFTDGGTAGLSTDQIFYYKEVTTAKATTASGLGGDTVRYTLSDGNKEVWKKTATYGTTYSFSLTSLALEKMYTLRAEVLKNGKVIAEGTRQIYRVNRPKALSADGTYRKVAADGTVGEVVNPILMYNVSTDQYAKMAEAGVNVVQGYVNGSTIAAAKAAGVQILGVLYSGMLPAGHPDKAAATRQTVRKYKDEEAVFGWIIMDEPYYNLVDREAGPQYDEGLVDTWLANSYRVIHEEDPNHPVFVMQDGGNRYKKAANFTDILGIDAYLFDDVDNYDMLFKATQKAVNATEDKKPVYALMQTYRYTTKTVDYLPTAAHVRHMVYQTRLAGAKGFGYYKYGQADGSLNLSQTATWEGLKTVAAEKDFLFSLPKGKESGGVVTATAQGKTVQLIISAEGKILEGQYASGSKKELLDIDVLALTQENRLFIENETAPTKRFLWTDGQSFLCPPAV